MPAKLLKRCCIGFLLGAAVGAAILWQIGAPGEKTGAILARLLLSGFYGACCMGGTVLYGIESWPLLKSTALHGLIVTLLYAPIALLLGWVDTARALMLMEGIMLALFLLIWLVMYLRWKTEVQRLNDLLKKKKEHGLL